jgi:D-sedoheptulose 7-phosphate isomerase
MQIVMDHIQDYILVLQQTMDQLHEKSIADVIRVLQLVRMRGNQVFIMGNGGSASTASHFVCDLAKNTRRKGLPDFRVIGLTDNMAIFSAYANDEGYENSLSQQLVNLVQPGDVAIGISASGNSKNVINAMVEAQKHNATAIGFTGFDGGYLGQMVDINIHVKSNIIEHVEDIHLMLEHMIVKIIKEQLHPMPDTTPSIAKSAAEVSAD